MNLNLCRKDFPKNKLFSYNLLLVMKLTVLMLFIGCLQVSAEGFAQRITLSKKYSSYRNIFKAITGKTVVIKKENADIEKPELFYVIVINVPGVVTDATGAPLPGASIQVKGSKAMAVSSSSGQFTIDAKVGDILVVKYIGYVTKEITVTASADVLRIALEPAKEDLQEVVVTALGIKRTEKSLGYAVQKVSGNTIQTVKGVDLGTSLTGRVAGLVIKNSTEFNARPSLELRGEEALLVIDGVPYENMTLRDVPTDDIESMDILKGSTASALYGSRAVGGVLLITTKKGAAGKGLSVDLNSNTMFQLGYLAIPEVQSSYGRGQNGEIDNDYVWGPKLDVGNTARDWNPVTMQFEDNRPLVSVGKDNLKNFMNTGLITNNNIALAQTGENGSFRIGLNHVYNKGQFPNQKLNIMNFTSGGEIQINDKFKVESRFGVSRRTAPQVWGGGYGTQGYLYQLMMWTGTEYDIRDYKNYWKEPNKTQNWMYTNWYDNPYLIAYEKLDGIIQNTVNANVTANYKFNEDFNLMLRLGYDNFNNKETMTNPTANIFSTRGGDIGGWNAKGLYRLYNKSGFSTNDDLILTYNKKVSKWSFDGLAGGTLYYYMNESSNAATKGGLISPRFFSLKGSVEPPTIDQGGSSRQINSLYGRASVGWSDAVFLDFTGRNDWNSAQPKESMSFFYPSIGSSVVLSELIKMPAAVDMFKLRGSWTVFKYASDPYNINSPYSTKTSAWNNLNSADYPSYLVADNVLPTSARTWEIGAAGYLFQKRLHFDVAYYNKYYYNRQTDLNDNGNTAFLPSSSGFSRVIVNTKETFERRGLEITIDGSVIKSNDFEWMSTINWSNQHRYYVDTDPIYTPDNLWAKKGERMDTYTSSYWLRDPDGNVIYNNGFPVESDYDKKYGYGDPDFSFGFMNHFRYKNWNLGINIDGRIGGLMYNYLYDKMWDTGTNPDTDNQYRYDQVVKGLNNYIGNGVKVISGDVTYDKYGAITSDTRQYAKNDVEIGYQSFAQEFRGGDMGIQSESFVKLREISLAYSFPVKLATKLGLKRASVSVTGQNLLMWTNFKFSDPDVDTEDLNSPSQRMLGFNIKVGL